MSETNQHGEQNGAQDGAQVSSLREERLLLLLSIFIGVISGLLVVSFRMAIAWLSVLLRAPLRSRIRRG